MRKVTILATVETYSLRDRWICYWPGCTTVTQRSLSSHWYPICAQHAKVEAAQQVGGKNA